MEPHPKNAHIMMLKVEGKAPTVAAFTSVGCYPVFYMTKDGGTLCPACVQEHLDLCVGDPGDVFNAQWEVIAHDANWEDPELHCDHCEKRIESAYAEDQRGQETQG
jgi:hypothetical protein